MTAKWNSTGVLGIFLESGKILVLAFNLRSRNKYLVAGNIEKIYLYGNSEVVGYYFKDPPPLRNLSRLIKRVVMNYDGDITETAFKWLMEERKRITKDIKIQG